MRKIKVSIAIILVLLILILGGIWWEFLGKRAINLPQVAKDWKTVEYTRNPSILVKNLRVPWALDFLPEEKLIFTERPGRLTILNLNNLEEKKVFTIPEVKALGEGGLLGLAVHPKFQENNVIYLYFSYEKNEALYNKVVRYQLKDQELQDPKTLIDDIPGANIHNGGRIAFGPDGYLYITTGDANLPNSAQDLNSLAGKILRIQDDGSIPKNNPFSGLAIYSYGHRNPQGLAWDKNGQLWSTEHGPKGHDEINRIQAGKNYGWPLIVGKESRKGMEVPVLESGNATWAPAAAVFNDNFLYFTGLRGRSLYRFDPQNTKLRSYLVAQFGRLRELKKGPGGLLYLSTSNRDGRGLARTEDDLILIINPRSL